MITNDNIWHVLIAILVLVLFINVEVNIGLGITHVRYVLLLLGVKFKLEFC